MILLDIRTIVLSNIVTNIICLLFIFMLWRQSKDRFLGTGFWVLNSIFQATALFLIVLQGVIPDWISIVLAGTMIIAGGILGFVGLEIFTGEKWPRIYNYLLLPLFIFIHSYFTFIQPSLTGRITNISLAMLLIFFQGIMLLWYRVGPTLRPLTFGTGMVFFLYGIVSIISIGNFLIGTHKEGYYLQSGNFEALILICYQVLFILLTYSLVLMVNKRLLINIRTHEETFAKAFHSSPSAIAITRFSDGTIINVNKAFISTTGYERAEIIGKKILDLNILEHDEDRVKLFNELSRNDRVYGLELSFLKKNGETVTGLLSSEIILIAGERNIISNIENITERKRAEKALRESEKRYRELSIIDDLTQLYNSRHFYRQLKMEMNRADRYEQPLALILLDIDNFKAFNDTYGHVEGDQVLSRLGQVVKRCLRQADSAYRYGGEEFVIILPMTTKEEGLVTAERIRVEFKRENFSPEQGKFVNLTISIGVTQYRTDEDMKVFVHRVDQLMYKGKNAGKDRVYSES
ncbi:MAG: diguanylate cyclase [Pseudomonadota bacterium]